MGTRSATPRKTLIGLAAVVLGVVIVVLFWRSYSDSSPTTQPAPSASDLPSVHGIDFRRTTLYHSPQTPGYTSWTGAWVMPDQSIMVAFVKATGPTNPADRARAPRSVIDSFGLTSWPAQRDFWGLKTSVKYLSSSDGGDTWIPARVDKFHSLFPAPYLPQADAALKDGTIIRRVNGDDLRFDPSVPHTAFLQRLVPGGKTWSAPQVLMDPAKYTYQISRIRYLRDGRLVATGNVWDTPASTKPAQRADLPSRYLLLVSSDNGKTWQDGLTQPPDVGYLPGEEWDTAELPNGDLVALMRTYKAPGNSTEVRKQALLKKDGEGWVMTRVADAPFPPSGHPELLATQEGPVLSIATTGIDYTKDGVHWQALRFSPKFDYKSNYYPRAVQTDDGVIHVFSHVGGDDPYGGVDQSITSDQFQLQTDSTSGGAGPG
jgi:hypothetical protein